MRKVFKPKRYSKWLENFTISLFDTHDSESHDTEKTKIEIWFYPISAFVLFLEKLPLKYSGKFNSFP